jgi:hypothetical protein
MILRKEIKHRLCSIVLVLILQSFIILAAQTSLSGLKIISSATTTEISQYGITWTFNKPVEFGTFINGDYWIVGPVEVINISPQSIEMDGRTINGSMINPSIQQIQGYDYSMYMSYGPSYSEALNVARPGGNTLSDSNPLQLQPGESLISTISDQDLNDKDQLTDAAILTVLRSAPSLGSFRPPYAGFEKTIQWNTTDILWNLLPRLSSSGVSNVPSLKDVLNYVQRPYLQHTGNWLIRYMVPSNNQPGYGQDFTRAIGNASLLVMLDHSVDEIEQLVVGLIQMGIDLHRLAQMGHRWDHNGGIMHGRKWPILFAGLMFNDNSPDGLLEWADYKKHNIFQEDQQHFFVSQTDVDMTHSISWAADDRDGQFIPFESDDIGLPEWGVRYLENPAKINNFWGSTYRWINSESNPGNVLCSIIMGAREYYNPATWQYLDRWKAYSDTVSGNYFDRFSSSGFIVSMWENYRKNYPPVWE